MAAGAVTRITRLIAQLGKLGSVRLRPRAFWISLCNVVGLVFSLVGLLLLFCYALPNEVPGAPGVRSVDGASSDWEKQQRRYRTYANLGLTLALVGTILEGVPPVCTAIGSARRRRRRIPPSDTPELSNRPPAALGAGAQAVTQMAEPPWEPTEPQAVRDNPARRLAVVRQEFEQRGVESVRGWLNSTKATPREGLVALPPLPDGTMINRGDIEDWLREMDAAAAAKEERRHVQIIRLGLWTLVVAVVAAVAGIVAAWPVVQGWVR